MAVAQVAMADDWSKDPAPEALFFHAKRVRPGWGKAQVATIGHHVFYRYVFRLSAEAAPARAPHNGPLLWVPNAAGLALSASCSCNGARSAERRVGKECVSTCRSRGSAVH